VTCPDCHGVKQVEVSYGDPNDWETYMAMCKKCDGSGEIEGIECARCRQQAPASEIVDGGTLDGMLLGFKFCPACADVLAEPPAYPRVEVAA
jgi:hypothetical protein